MLLWRDPDVAIAPFAEFPQLLYLEMIVLDIVFDRQTLRVEDAHVAAQSEEDARALEGQKAGVRAGRRISLVCDVRGVGCGSPTAQAAVKHEHPQPLACPL